jgi:pyruvate formate lyase activating enzyme
MKIAGLVRSSLIDYPGKITAVVFTQGCNFRCGFCHNPDLITLENSEIKIESKKVIDFLKTRIGKLEGVVITGGEPLIQGNIEGFIKEIKAMGFSVKLDTNGSNPAKLSQLITNKLIDFVAMDIKGPISKYSKICAYPNTKVIQKSINIIMKSGLDYEFRTTVLPAYHDISDFEDIGKLITGAKLYTIQGFRSEITLDTELKGTNSFSRNELEDIYDVIAPYVQKVVIHDNISGIIY